MDKNKIVFISDVHLGRLYPSSSNARHGDISILTWDEIYEFERFIDMIIARNDVFLIIDGGDFFDGKHIKYEILDYLYKTIFKKLRDAKIGIIIITGNHDAYEDYNKKSSIEFLDYFLVQNCMIIRKLSCLTTEGIFIHGSMKSRSVHSWWAKFITPFFEQFKIGVALFPFASTDTLKKEYYIPLNCNNSDNPIVTNSDLQDLICQIQVKNKELLEKCNISFEIGHYGLSGAKLNSLYPVSIQKRNKKTTPISEPDKLTSMGLDREFLFNANMVASDQYDYALFGHFHCSQSVIASNTMHIGSFNYRTFGEINDEKRYLVFDCDQKEMYSISLLEGEFQIRPIQKIEIEIPKDHIDPNKFIIESILNQVNPNAKCKIICKGVKTDLNRLNLSIILNEIANKTYNVIIENETIIEQSSILVDSAKKLSLSNYVTLWNEYMQSFKNQPNYEKIMENGLKAINFAKEQSKITDE